jgi:hypothetical protein
LTGACATLGACCARRPIPHGAFSSRVPQILNTSFAREIFDRFGSGLEPLGLDAWSLYFNVARQIYPRYFAAMPAAALSWPIRLGEIPEAAMREAAFETYDPRNYAAGGSFAGLDPLADREAKIGRSLDALGRLRR